MDWDAWLDRVLRGEPEPPPAPEEPSAWGRGVRGFAAGVGDFAFNTMAGLSRLPNPFQPFGGGRERAQSWRDIQDEYRNTLDEAGGYGGVAGTVGYLAGGTTPYLVGGPLIARGVAAMAPEAAAAGYAGRALGQGASMTERLAALMGTRMGPGVGVGRRIAQDFALSAPIAAAANVGTRPEESVAGFAGEAFDSPALRALSQSALGRVATDALVGGVAQTALHGLGKGWRWTRHGSVDGPRVADTRPVLPDVLPSEAANRRLEEVQAQIDAITGRGAAGTPTTTARPTPPPPAAALEAPSPPRPASDEQLDFLTMSSGPRLQPAGPGGYRNPRRAVSSFPTRDEALRARIAEVQQKQRMMYKLLEQTQREAARPGSMVTQENVTQVRQAVNRLTEELDGAELDYVASSRPEWQTRPTDIDAGEPEVFIWKRPADPDADELDDFDAPYFSTMFELPGSKPGRIVRGTADFVVRNGVVEDLDIGLSHFRDPDSDRWMPYGVSGPDPKQELGGRGVLLLGKNYKSFLSEQLRVPRPLIRGAAGTRVTGARAHAKELYWKAVESGQRPRDFDLEERWERAGEGDIDLTALSGPGVPPHHSETGRPSREVGPLLRQLTARQIMELPRADLIDQLDMAARTHDTVTLEHVDDVLSADAPYFLRAMENFLRLKGPEQLAQWQAWRAARRAPRVEGLVHGAGPGLETDVPTPPVPGPGTGPRTLFGRGRMGVAKEVEVTPYVYQHPKPERGGMRVWSLMDGRPLQERPATRTGTEQVHRNYYSEFQTIDPDGSDRIDGVLAFQYNPLSGAVDNVGIRITHKNGELLPHAESYRQNAGRYNLLGYRRITHLVRATARNMAETGVTNAEESRAMIQKLGRALAEGERMGGARYHGKEFWDVPVEKKKAQIDFQRLLNRMLRDEGLESGPVFGVPGMTTGTALRQVWDEGGLALAGTAYGAASPLDPDATPEERAQRALLFGLGGSAAQHLLRQAGAMPGGRLRSGPALGGAPTPPNRAPDEFRFKWQSFRPKADGTLDEYMHPIRDSDLPVYMRGNPQDATLVNAAHERAWQNASSGQPGGLLSQDELTRIDDWRAKLAQHTTEQLDPEDVGRFVQATADANPLYLNELREELVNRLQLGPAGVDAPIPIYVVRRVDEGPRTETYVRAFIDSDDALDNARAQTMSRTGEDAALTDIRIDRGYATLKDVYGLLSTGTEGVQLIVRNPLTELQADPGERALAFALRRSNDPTVTHPIARGDASSVFYTGPGIASAALPQGTRTSAARLLAAGVEAAGGALLAQSEDERWRQTGYGLLALSAYTAARASGTEQALAAGIKARAKGLGQTHGLVRKALDFISPRIMLDDSVIRAIDEAELTRTKYRTRSEKLAQRAEALGPEADRLLTDLVTGERFSTYVPTPEETKELTLLAADVINMFDELYQQKVALGLLPSGLDSQHYLPRYQLRHMLEEEDRLTPYLRTQNPQGPRLRTEQRRTLGTSPEDVRAREFLGEIRESSYAIRHGGERQGVQIANAKLMEALRLNPGAMHPMFNQRLQAVTLAHQAWLQAAQTRSPHTPALKDLYRQEVEATRKWSRSFRMNANWKRLPDSDALGPLAGAVVSREVADYVIGTPVHRTVYDNMLRLWKSSKTAYNLPTHVGNFSSNIYLAHMAGVPLWRLPGALSDAAASLRNYDLDAQFLAERGVLNKNVLTAEGSEQAFEMIHGPAARFERELRKLMRTTRPATKDVLQEYGFEPLPEPGRVKRLAGKVHETAVQWYSNEDNWFRVAVYKDQLRRGVKPEAAADYAKWALVDYDTKSPLLAMARRTAWPFILFPVKALPMVMQQAADHPIRFLTAAALFAGGAEVLESQFPEMSAQDVPANIRKPLFGYLLPRAVPTGVGPEGQRYFTDVTRLTPFSAATTVAPPGAALGQLFPNTPLAAVQPSGPIMDLANLASNRDPYSGQPVFRPGERLEPGQVALDAASYLAQRAVPPMVGFHGPRILGDIREGRTSDLPTDLLGMVGARPRIIPRGEAGKRALARYNEAVRDIETAWRYQAQRARNSESAREEANQTYQRRMQKALERYREDMRQ